jgi:hypothetical protein
MRPARLIVTFGAVLFAACSSDTPAGGPTGAGDLGLSGSPVVESASGGYHFVTEAHFFGIPIENRLTFSAERHADGSLTGRYNYEQGALGERFIFRGSVTCFEIHDTPVLQDWEEIPAMTANRAKWGGLIEYSNDPTLPAGGFIWFNSIDNGEGAGAPPDLSSISGFGDEAANEAFCASVAPPNPTFGPHPIIGNIEVRP